MNNIYLLLLLLNNYILVEVYKGLGTIIKNNLLTISLYYI